MKYPVCQWEIVASDYARPYVVYVWGGGVSAGFSGLRGVSASTSLWGRCGVSASPREHSWAVLLALRWLSVSPFFSRKMGRGLLSCQYRS